MTFARPIRWVATAGLAATLVATSGVALAQTSGPAGAADCSTLHFSLANPTAGDVLQAGSYMVEGVAFDSAASTQQGTGVDRVEFFMDDRDAGGKNLGAAVLGAPSAGALAGSQFGMAGFRLNLDLLAESSGHTLFAYAHSSVTDQEQVLSVPIQVGEETDAQVVPGGAVATTGRQNCAAPSPTQASATGTAVIQATPQPAAVSAPTPAPATLHLMLDNPESGNSLLPGAYSISGTAYDARATNGAGIDRVEIFLGDRDQGGTILGAADLQAATAATLPLGRFEISVDLPNQNAGSTLFAYARSSVTGQETVVAIPVIIGTLPE